MYATAKSVLENVNELIEKLEAESPYIRKYGYATAEVCNYLSIFDWWVDRIHMSHLKAMRSFLKTAIAMGFDGYVCFKVGVSGCASGMWAYKEESEDGYSPDGDFIYRTFQSSNNYWDAEIGGVLLSESVGRYDAFRTSAQLKKAMAA